MQLKHVVTSRSGSRRPPHRTVRQGKVLRPAPAGPTTHRTETPAARPAPKLCAATSPAGPGWLGREGRLGQVNHLTTHCSLAKFHNLIIEMKYGAVIGWKKPITWKLRLSTHNDAIFLANHSAVFHLDHQITESRQTIRFERWCEVQWMTPPSRHPRN
jgi:hypothetical protein